MVRYIQGTRHSKSWLAPFIDEFLLFSSGFCLNFFFVKQTFTLIIKYYDKKHTKRFSSSSFFHFFYFCCCCFSCPIVVFGAVAATAALFLHKQHTFDWKMGMNGRNRTIWVKAGKKVAFSRSFYFNFQPFLFFVLICVNYCEFLMQIVLKWRVPWGKNRYFDGLRDLIFGFLSDIFWKRL